MQRLATRLATLGALVLALSVSAAAQRQVIIEPGPPGTFNNTIKADIDAGTAANTTYVLRRGGLYLYNAQLLVPVSLSIVAEAGAGPRPIIQAVFGSTQAPRPLRITGNDVTVNVRGLYFYGLDNIGADTDNATIRIAATNVTLNVDDCHFDANRLTSLQADKDGASMFVSNTIFSNIFNLSTNFGYAIFLNVGVKSKEIRFTNTTFYNNNSLIFNNAGRADVVEFRHVTVHNTGGALDFTDVVDGGVTNKFVFLDNIVYNGGYYGNTPTRPFRYVVAADTVFNDVDMNPDTPSIPQPLNFNVGFSNLYFDPAISAIYADSVTVRPRVSPAVQAYFDATPGREATFLNEPLAFANPPSTSAVIARLQYTYQNGSEAGAPFLDKDPRDPANTPASPPSTAAEQLPVDFSYPTSAASYTAANNGCPLGDLNWFPGVDATACLTVASAGGPAEATGFSARLAPNPVSSATALLFQLDAAATVTVTVSDLLGREVMQVEQAASAGAGHVRLDVSGLPSGLYVYRVRTSGGTVQTTTGRLTIVR